MPKVGKRHFAYTPKGKAAAKKYAKATGKPMAKKKKGGYEHGNATPWRNEATWASTTTWWPTCWTTTPRRRRSY